MRVINLCHGAGNGVDTACLMTASNMLIGRGEDKDDNSCVCPVLRSFIIRTNDAMPTEHLGELYGPLAWEILGTRVDDREVIQRRAYAMADWAVRTVAPLALDAAGLHQEAAGLRLLAEVVCPQSANAAADAARAAADAANAADAADAAHAADAAAHAANAAADAAADAARAAADAARAAAHAARAAAHAAYAKKIWGLCPEIIRKVASIGDKRPVETVIDAEELACRLARK